MKSILLALAVLLVVPVAAGASSSRGNTKSEFRPLKGLFQALLKPSESRHERVSPRARTRRTKSPTIHVDVSQQVLKVKEGWLTVATYRCSTGRKGAARNAQLKSNKTPLGQFVVFKKEPDHRFGRTMRLAHQENEPLHDTKHDAEARGIHIHPASSKRKMGVPGSAGCVTLAKNDANELFELIPTGTPVTIQL